MASMDVFNGSAFSTTSLTGMVEKIDCKPQLLGGLGIFQPMPVRTRDLFIDRRDTKLVLIPNSPLGAPPEERERASRDAVSMRTTRLVKSFTLYAEAVQGIRAHGQETELEGVATEFQREFGLIRDDMDLTHEHHRLGALQGRLLDADGTTVIYDYFAEFNEAEVPAVSFALNVATTNVRQLCKDTIRGMQRDARGSFTPATSVHALAGDEFYDALVDHPQVVRTYENYTAAAQLRANAGGQGLAFEAFTYGNITFHNYRGTDDTTTVGIASDECKFFPVGARDMFKVAYGPAEFEPFINTAGRETYALTIPDRDRRMWQKGEIYSYPLYFCQQPRVLRKATLT